LREAMGKEMMYKIIFLQLKRTIAVPD